MHIAINAHLLSAEAGYRQTGVSRYISNLLPALVRAGSGAIRWTVFAPPGVDLSQTIPPSAPVTVLNSILPTFRPITRIIWEQLIGPFAVAWQQPDVLLCPLNVVPLLAPCPTVVTVHDLAFLRLKTHRASRRSYLSRMTRRSVHRSTHVIAVSDFTRREVIELLGTPPHRVTAIPNGCDPAFTPLGKLEVETWRKKHDLPPLFLLFVGTLEPRKNLTGLIEAYARFRKSQDVPLLVVGAPGWRYTPIYDIVRSLGLESHVRFEGFVSAADLPFYYAAATAFVYPSFYEGFGLPPLEAMAMGTPVITSNVSSLPQVVGDAALLISPHSREELAAAMVKIVTDETLRTTLSAAGREQASQFSWDASASSVLSILRSAATRDPHELGAELSVP